MTANEDALVVDLDAIDLFEITDKWLQTCPSCDAGLPATCTHPADDYRNVVSDLVDALAFARASIGPDEVAVPVSRAAIGHLAQFGCAHGDRVGCSPGNCWALKSIALAALSQPRP